MYKNKNTILGWAATYSTWRWKTNILFHLLCVFEFYKITCSENDYFR